MDKEKMQAKSKEVFATLCRALDQEEWHYEKNEEELTVECGAKGDDFPIELKIKVDSTRYLVLVASSLAFTIPEEKRFDLAVASTYVNERLVNGSFDMNLGSGSMHFRMANSFIGCDISEDVFLYMIYTTCNTVDQYNDRFFLLCKNMITLEQFLEKANENED